MQPTTFVYSSHDRSEYIHRWWIVERALQSPDNKTILHLPMSEGSEEDMYGPQHFNWSKFEWYFNSFKKWGLNAFPFYWSNDLKREDAEALMDHLANCEVVILGGGNSSRGLARYKALGEYFFGDRDLFAKILHDRQNRGKLTVGFSAGADQLCQYLSSEIFYGLRDPHGFGMASNVITTLHHEPQRREELYVGAKKFPQCMVFGLPNDSGIAVNQGVLPSGNIWQVIEFVTDKSWDVPSDEFHIKTRSGVGIEHYYNDGRHWSFNGGDKMVRAMSPDGSWQEIFIITNQGTPIHYWTQNTIHTNNVEEILSWY
jgi:hypothetical protein